MTCVEVQAGQQPTCLKTSSTNKFSTKLPEKSCWTWLMVVNDDPVVDSTCIKSISLLRWEDKTDGAPITPPLPLEARGIGRVIDLGTLTPKQRTAIVRFGQRLRTNTCSEVFIVNRLFLKLGSSQNWESCCCPFCVRTNPTGP